eukprot:9067514-Alexandrium_andersonii.AAC.1
MIQSGTPHLSRTRRSQGSPTRSNARDWSANRIARQVSAGCPACSAAIRRRHGPAGPMTASHSGGGSWGRTPPGRGPAPRRWAKAARRFEPQSPPATAVWCAERRGSRMGPASSTSI